MIDHQPNWLETADRIGRRLCRDAIWSGQQCNWMGWSTEPMDGSWTEVYRSLGPDFYGGTAGIALFLARLAKFTGDRYQHIAAVGALNQALQQLQRINGSARIGFFSGAAGIARAMIDVGELTGREDLIARGVRELRAIGREPPHPEAIDVISGSAGVIPVLLAAWRRFDCCDLLSAAHEHGQFLLRQANRRDEGWSWKTLPGVEQPDLTGYSHGAAGIVVALLELWRATAENRYREAAEQGLRYERHHFSREQRNWPDFRSFGQTAQPPSYGLAWCHGAPGIGLARLRTYQLLAGDAQVLEEIDAALETTLVSLTQPFVERGSNFSLCHGQGGNAELPLVASQILGRPQLRSAAERIAQLGVEYIDQRDLPWPCGTTYGRETPNLMLGLAGIGYFYLRLFDTADVPSVLFPANGDAVRSSHGPN